MLSRSQGRLKNSRARATKNREPVTQSGLPAAAQACPRCSAAENDGTTSAAMVSGTNCVSSLAGTALGWSDAVRMIRSATGASASMRPCASCPAPTPTISVQRSRSAPRLLASPCAACGLWAPSSMTSGSALASSNRPGQTCLATRCSSAGGSGARPKWRAAASAKPAFSP